MSRYFLCRPLPSFSVQASYFPVPLLIVATFNVFMLIYFVSIRFRYPSTRLLPHPSFFPILLFLPSSPSFTVQATSFLCRFSLSPLSMFLCQYVFVSIRFPYTLPLAYLPTLPLFPTLLLPSSFFPFFAPLQFSRYFIKDTSYQGNLSLISQKKQQIFSSILFFALLKNSPLSTFISNLVSFFLYTTNSAVRMGGVKNHILSSLKYLILI